MLCRTLVAGQISPLSGGRDFERPARIARGCAGSLRTAVGSWANCQTENCTGRHARIPRRPSFSLSHPGRYRGDKLYGRVCVAREGCALWRALSVGVEEPDADRRRAATGMRQTHGESRAKQFLEQRASELAGASDTMRLSTMGRR